MAEKALLSKAAWAMMQARYTYTSGTITRVHTVSMMFMNSMAAAYLAAAEVTAPPAAVTPARQGSRMVEKSFMAYSVSVPVWMKAVTSVITADTMAATPPSVT